MIKNLFLSSISKYSSKYFSILLLAVILIGLFSLTTALPNTKLLGSNLPVQAQSETEKPNIFITRSNKYSYQNGGLISFTSTEDPLIQIGAYKISGEAKIQIYQASLNDALDFLTHDLKNNQTKPVKPENLTQIGSLTQTVTDQAEAKNFSLPLPQSGIFLVTASVNSISTKVMVIRSKFGVMVSENPSQYVFWAQDYNNKRSLTSGSISTYNLLDNAKIIETSSFDTEGVAITKAVVESDVAIAQNGDDVAIIPINLSYLNVENDYKRFAQNTKTTRYFVFTDRPIYKPGDKISFKAIIRDDEDVKFSIPSGKVKVSLTGGAQNTKILDNKEFAVSENGSISGELTLPQFASTGDYSLDISKVNPKSDSEYNDAGSAYFKVEYYKKPEYKLQIKLSSSEIILGQGVEMSVSASYFSGGPVANQKVNYRVAASNFYQYELQTKLNPNDEYRYWSYASNTLEEGEIMLDNEGQAKITLDTNKYLNLSGENSGDLKKGQNKIITAEASLKDQTQNPVLASQNLIGYASSFDIYRQNYENYSASINQKYNLPLVLAAHSITKDKTVINNRSLQAKIKRTWSEKVEKPDQKYPDWISKEENLPDQSLTTNNKGQAILSFTPTKSGSYEITVESKDVENRMIINKFNAWVSDIGQPNWSGNESGIVKIETDKPEYKLGEVAKIKVFSENPNSDVFISMERAKQSRFKVVRLTGKNTVLELPILDNDLPNIFIRASTFSNTGLDISDQGLKVSAENKKLNVTIVPDKKSYGPGETVRINIETKDSFGRGTAAETAIWAVDKAIFELQKTNTPNIFQTFYFERYNQTQQSDSLRGVAVVQGGAEMGSGCFTGDTLVLMSDGNHKPIQNIQVGDFVQTRSDENQSQNLVPAKVKEVLEHTVNGYLIVNSSLKVTPEHRIFTRHAGIDTQNPLFSHKTNQNSDWVAAGNLQIGDIVFDTAGKEIKINSIEWQAGITKVYNLEIETYHTFFAGDIFVHNDKGGSDRTIFADTAYWNPTVKTDINGKASLTFKLPDNLTTWVIAGISATNDTKIGETQTEITSTKPIIIRPIVPNILRIGDVSDISAIIQNNSGQDLAFGSELTFPNGEILEADKNNNILKDKESRQVFWKIKPIQTDKASKLTFATFVENDTSRGDRTTLEIPIQNYGFTEKITQTGDKPKEYSISPAQKDSDLKLSKISLQLSSTILGTLPKSMEYLIGYPYGCAEQTTSRFAPAVIALENKDIYSTALKDFDGNKLLDQGIDRLAQLQQSNGGWSFWSSGNSDPFISTYVVEYLNKAFALKPELKDRFLSQAKTNPQYYFETLLNDPTQKEAYVTAVYALSSMKNFDLTGELISKSKVSITDFDKLSPDILAVAVMANYRNGDKNPKTNGLEKLISLGKIEGDGLYWEAGDVKRFGSIDASTALVLRAIVETKGDKDFASKTVRFIKAAKHQDYWSNTFATSQIIRSLTEYAKQNSEFDPNYDYTVFLDDAQIATGKISKTTDLVDLPIDFKQIKNSGSKLKIVQSGASQKGQIYSTLIASEFRTDPNYQSKTQGLSINRQYVNTRGENQGLVVGDTVDVRLSVSGLKTIQNYAMISDELPAGLIPINKNLDNEQFNTQDNFSNEFLPITDIEYTQNGANLHVWEVKPETQTFVYQARVIASGNFKAPPAKAEIMYSPEILGLSKSDLVTTSTSPFTVASSFTPTFNTSGKNQNTPTTTDYSIKNISPVDGSAQRNTLIIALAIIIAIALGLAVFSLKLSKKHGHGLFAKKSKEKENTLIQHPENEPNILQSPVKDNKPTLKEIKAKQSNIAKSAQTKTKVTSKTKK